MKNKKNSVKKNTKKNNIEKKKLTLESLKILVCTIFAISTCVICYKTYYTALKEKNNKYNQNISKESIDKKTYETLISYIPYYLFSSGIYKDAYNGTLMKASNVEDTLIAKSIFGRYEESYTFKNGNTEEIITLLKNNNLSEKEVVYYKSDINNFLTKRYNVDLSMLKNLSATITNLNNEYLTVNIKSTFTPERSKVTVSYITYNEGEDIIIYEKAVFVRTNTNDNKYYVYANSNINSKDLPIKIYDITDETGKRIDISEALTKDLTDYKTLFKHTFKKNGNGYYWYSTVLES